MTRPKFDYIASPHRVVEWVEHKKNAGRVPVYAAVFRERGKRYSGLGAKDRARRAAALAGA